MPYVSSHVFFGNRYRIRIFSKVQTRESSTVSMSLFRHLWTPVATCSSKVDEISDSCFFETSARRWTLLHYFPKKSSDFFFHFSKSRVISNREKFKRRWSAFNFDSRPLKNHRLYIYIDKIIIDGWTTGVGRRKSGTRETASFFKRTKPLSWRRTVPCTYRFPSSRTWRKPVRVRLLCANTPTSTTSQ